MCLPPLAVTDFPLVLALSVLCRLRVVTLVAAEAEVCICARTLRLLLGLIHSRRHVPSFARLQQKLRLL